MAKRFLELRVPLADKHPRIDWMRGLRVIWGDDPEPRMGPAAAEACLRHIFELGQGTWRESLGAVHRGGVMMHQVRSGLSSAFDDHFNEDLIRGAVDQRQIDKREQEIVIRIEYDPSAWFVGDTEWYDHASGRLYWLAKSGVLEAAGLQVAGSDLDG